MRHNFSIFLSSDIVTRNIPLQKPSPNSEHKVRSILNFWAYPFSCAILHRSSLTYSGSFFESMSGTFFNLIIQLMISYWFGLSKQNCKMLTLLSTDGDWNSSFYYAGDIVIVKSLSLSSLYFYQWNQQDLLFDKKVPYLYDKFPNNWTAVLLSKW